MLSRDKKGALELSITAIVVLIIAITLLGFAIFFIKNLFGRSVETFSKEFQKIEEQLRKNMEETGEIVTFDVGSEIELKRGKSKTLYLGLKNELSSSPEHDTVCFRIGIRCIKPFTPDRPCIIGGSNEPVYVGGFDDTGTPVTAENAWFRKMLGLVDVKNNEFYVSRVDLQITQAEIDNYLMELVVQKPTGKPVPCSEQPEFDTYATKRFTIILT